MNDFRDRLYGLVSGLYLSIKASHDEMVEKAFEWLEADDSDLKTGWIEKEDEIIFYSMVNSLNRQFKAYQFIIQGF
jgi:hypothetical protein